MILEKRKTYNSIVKRALKKCTKMYRNGVVAYCTPAEYVALCLHFKHPVETIKPYYINDVKKGDMFSTTHYFRVNEGIDSYPVNQWAILSHTMVGWNS